VTAAELAAAEASARVAETELERAFVRAPSDGQVVKITARIGERVGNDGVMSIAAAGPMAIRAEVFESDVPRLRLGQPVTATAPALQGRVSGRITRVGTEIARQTIMREDPSADTDARVVEVDIGLDETSSDMVRSLNNLRVRVRFEE
jgi:HlyD family secretion protein